MSSRRIDFDNEAFIRVWNSCTDVEQAFHQLCGLYRSATLEEIREHSQLLHQAGYLVVLPVVQDGEEISDAAMFEFCTLWHRCATFAEFCEAIRLSETTAGKRYWLLTTLGIRLLPKDDLPAPPTPAEGAPSIQRQRRMSARKVNEILDGELLVRTAVLNRHRIRNKVQAAFALLQQTNKETLNADLDSKLQGVIALLQDVFRDLGVAE